MIQIRKSDERGHANHGWLDTHFTFSFSDYYDSKHVHFRTLRVMNDDRVAGGGGFPMHPHRDMEIVTYVLEGALEHRDSMGLGAVIKPAYGQKNFSATEKRGKLRLLVSPDGRDGSLKIRQDNELYASLLRKDETVRHDLKPDRHAYVQVARGSVTLNGNQLDEGDGAAISQEKAVELTGVKDAEVLLF